MKSNSMFNVSSKYYCTYRSFCILDFSIVMHLHARGVMLRRIVGIAYTTIHSIWHVQYVNIHPPSVGKNQNILSFFLKHE
jgi:hypothetical protein